MEQRRTALITGASAGLGAEFARQLGAQGCNLVLVARRRERLETIARPLRQRHGIETTILEADLADRSAPQQLWQQLQDRQIEVDYLINNAGSGGGNLLKDRDFEEHARYLELMVLSVAHMCHLFVPPMQERGFGRVINVASVAARIPRSGGCIYGPSKAFLVNMSEELHLTTRKQGVNVSALCPGFTHTEFHAVAGKLDMKESSPGFLWYDADVVVQEGLRAVEKGKPVQVSGRIYRLLDPLFQSVWTRRLFRLSG